MRKESNKARYYCPVRPQVGAGQVAEDRADEGGIVARAVEDDADLDVAAYSGLNHAEVVFKFDKGLAGQAHLGLSRPDLYADRSSFGLMVFRSWLLDS